MAKMKRSVSKIDEFPNFYRARCLSEVDAIKFTAWTTGYSLKDQIGFIVHKITWRPLISSLKAMNADGDRLIFGLTARQDLAIADLESPVNDAVLVSKTIGMRVATNVGETVLDNEYVSDFSNEPGGGRLIAPKPLYFAMASQGIGGTIDVTVEVCYTQINLTEALYRELYESMNPSA